MEAKKKSSRISLLNRMLSAFLTLVMVISMLPMTSLAAEISVEDSNLVVEEPKMYTTGTYTLKDVSITGGPAQSAITIKGNVTLIIEGNVVLTGGDADAGNYKGAGAGIEVPAGSTLTLKGSGTLSATGGNAANGTNGKTSTIGINEDETYSNYQGVGDGGAGAGAGIGTKGANSAMISWGVSAAAPGNVIIDDENLSVEAIGGQGGNGGKGGNGGTAAVVEEFYRWWGVSYFGEQCYTDYTVVGGAGGGGGGGGGYPAAGIGAGGASGGAGGLGGRGGLDKNTIDAGVMVCALFSEDVDFRAGGGGGGGGGQGYVNGGGGGGGSAFCDTLYHGVTQRGALAFLGVPTRTRGGHNHSLVSWIRGGEEFNDYWDMLPLGSVHRGHDNAVEENGYCECAGVGGAPGEDAYHLKPMCACGKQEDGEGGKASGEGGELSLGRDSRRRGKSGDSGEASGKKTGGGTVTLQAGTLNAVSGGKGSNGAMDIGSGGGAGTANAGNLYVRGGALEEGDFPTPTNGSAQLYPVILRSLSYEDDLNTPTNVMVNDKEWGVNRFALGRSDGQITIWLPNGEYTAAVADTEGNFSCKYPVFKVESDRTEPVSDDILRVDLSEAPVTINETTVVQTEIGKTYPYTSAVYLYNSSDVGNEVVFAENVGKKRVTLQNASITTLTINSGCTATINTEGTQNNITTINNQSSDSADLIFEGDVTSVLNVGTIDNSRAMLQKYADDPYVYVSDVAIGVHGGSAEAAKQRLTDAGYNYVIDYDLNRNAGGHFIYLGFKVSTNPEDAIYSLLCSPKYVDSFSHNNITYHQIKCIGGNGDLNQDAGGDDIVMYYAKKKDFKNGPSYNPISHIQVYGDSDRARAIAKRDANIYTDWMLGIDSNGNYIDGGDPQCVNRKTTGGSDYIFIAFNRSFPGQEEYYKSSHDASYNKDAEKVQLIESRQEYQRAGDITMNSYGTVNIGSMICCNAYEYIPTLIGGSEAEVTLFDRWGTSNLTINRGRMTFDEYITWRTNNVDLYYIKSSGREHQYTWLPTMPEYLPASKTGHLCRIYGYNHLGSVTVNGGTLQLGDGTGMFPDGTDNGFSNDIKVTVKPGGNLLANYIAPDPSIQRIEMTGLPTDDHLNLIPDTIDGTAIGDFIDAMDIWTNENGNFITFSDAHANDGKEIVFSDKNGNAYRYILDTTLKDVNIPVTIAEKQDLPTYANPENGYDLRIYPKYMVQGKTLYAHTEGEDINATGTLQNILLTDNANVQINAADGSSMASITGDGTLILTSKGAAAVSGKIAVPAFTFTGGSVSASEITGDVTILGGSVKTNTPIVGAKNSETAVYQAILPLWTTDITVGDKAYPMDNAKSHGDAKTYIYVPADARFVTAGGEYFLLTFDEQTQTMQVCKRSTGDGYIDLSVGSAEILTDGEYIYNGQYYINENGENYKITGTSDANTLIVSDGNPVITLDGVNLTKQSIDIADSVDVTLTIAGENIISGSSGMPAIHVPTESNLTIEGTGVLTAEGGSGAPAIGGKTNEVNGKVTIKGGTLNLQGSNTHAIGAGSGAETPEGSIVITGGSVKTGDPYSGDSLGTTPVNAKGEKLSRVVLKLEGEGEVVVDSVKYNVLHSNSDGRLYLYVTSREQAISVGNKTYLVSPLNIASTEHGTISLRLVDEDAQIPLKSGDMVVEGTKIRVNTKADEGYGQVSGPTSGDYILTRMGGKLVLKASEGFGSFVVDDWTVDQTDAMTFSKELKGSETTVKMGVAGEGHASVMFSATGADITAEILVNGKVVKTAELDSTQQTIEYDWMSQGKEAVEIRFKGTGKVTLASALLSEIADSTNIYAKFAEVVTLTLVQPVADEENDEHIPGVILAYSADGMVLQDCNPTQEGIQVTAGTEVRIVFNDPEGGNIFEAFTLTDSNGTETTVTSDDPLEHTYSFKLTEDMTVKANTAWVEIHLSVGPVEFDDITYGDKSPAAKEITIVDDGNTAATIESVELTGDHSDSFVLTTASPLSMKGNTVKPKDGLTAGTHTAVITVSYNNGKIATAEVSVHVNKKSVEVPVIADKAYTGTNQTADIRDTDLYTVVKNDGGTEKGSYDVVLKLKDTENYKWNITDEAEVTVHFSISAAENSWEIAPSIDNWTYGENASVPKAVAKYGTFDVVYTGTANDGTDYNSETAPTKAGSYTATFNVEGTKDYSGLTGHAEFTIYKADYDMSSAKWEYTNAFDYDGKEHIVEVTGLPAGVNVKEYIENTAKEVGDYTAKVVLNYDNNNYNEPVLENLNWSIKNDWTPTEYTVSIPNDHGWLNKEFVIAAANGYKVALTNAENGIWSDSLTYTEETSDGSVTFYVKSEADNTISLAKTVDYKIDKTPATGKVEFVERSSWEDFVNIITFGLFYKDEITVKAEAFDELSGIARIEYASSDEALTLEQVMQITDWTEYTESIGVPQEDAKKFVYFIRVTDKAGNVTYLSTDGAEYDITAPVISGIEDGMTYYTTQKATVTDRNIDTISLNENPVSEDITLDGNKDEVYMIAATDKAGNSTTVTVTMKPIRELSAPIDSLNEDHVNSEDEQIVDDVKEAVEAIDITNATEAEKTALKEIADKVAELEQVIDDTRDEIARITEEMNQFQETTVNSDDVEQLEKLTEDIRVLLDGDNLTEEERAALTEKTVDIAELQKIIDDAANAINSENIKKVKDITSENVRLEDQTDLEKAKEDLKKALENYGENYTEDEKKAIEDEIKRIDDALKVIENDTSESEKPEKPFIGFVKVIKKVTEHVSHVMHSVGKILKNVCGFWGKIFK